MQLPSAMFEKSTDKKYTVLDRVGCYIARGLEYSLAGIVCGFVGQGIASGLMTVKYVYVWSRVALCIIIFICINKAVGYLDYCF